MRILNLVAFILLVIGGINWLLVGLFGFDLVAWAFGISIISSIIYVIIGLSALWLIFSAIRARRISFVD